MGQFQREEYLRQEQRDQERDEVEENVASFKWVLIAIGLVALAVGGLLVAGS